MMPASKSPRAWRGSGSRLFWLPNRLAGKGRLAKPLPLRQRLPLPRLPPGPRRRALPPPLTIPQLRPPRRSPPESPGDQPFLRLGDLRRSERPVASRRGVGRHRWSLPVSKVRCSQGLPQVVAWASKDWKPRGHWQADKLFAGPKPGHREGCREFKRTLLPRLAWADGIGARAGGLPPTPHPSNTGTPPGS